MPPLQGGVPHALGGNKAVLLGLRQELDGAKGLALLVVDMGWVVGNMQGVTGLENWGGVADRLSAHFDLPVVSLYNQDLTIEEQIQAALRAHRQFLAPRLYRQRRHDECRFPADGLPDHRPVCLCVRNSDHVQYSASNC